jgi:hypothetical protein
MVVRRTEYPGGFCYALACGDFLSVHYEQEISATPNQAMKMGYDEDDATIQN